MALNWAMLTEDGARPVPLPHEKIFYSVEHCSLSLDFKNQDVKWEAKGTAFVTNQRVLFLRQPPLPAPAEGTAPSAHLRSLSVPLANFVDTRYMIPIFAAPYYEAHVLPVRGGGLPEHVPGAPTAVGLAKIWFNEGGGVTFKDAVEEAKSRLDQGVGGHMEALPTYSPPPPGTSAATSLSPPPTSAALTSGSPSSAVSEPATEDLLAAAVAQQGEEEEDLQRSDIAASGLAPPDSARSAASTTRGAQEGPPGYDEACH